MLQPQLIGRELLKRGFNDYFLYMFELIEGRPFIYEPIHKLLFNAFKNIYNLEDTRVNINIPPRAGKTTLAQYFVSYAYAKNKKCNFIYTSYSEALLRTVADKVRSILNHPVYKAMFPVNIEYEEVETDPINDYWKDYIASVKNTPKFSSHIITTEQGGTTLFNAIGGQITGFGSSVRNAEGFSGALILDDPNKPKDMASKIMRQKVFDYFKETLLSRLNTSNAPIINIMQRLHTEDLSALLEQVYNFKTVKAPLILEDGTCQIPSQYTPERIKELQIDQFSWMAQYQQTPIIKGGQVIKRKWFKYYSLNQQYKYVRLLIAADTAQKVKQHNDYSVFMVGGVTQEGKIHILDIWRGKWEAPELERNALEIYEKYKFLKHCSVCCSGLFVEDKASGTGLIQNLHKKGVPVKGTKAENDKLSRVMSIASYLENGTVLLPSDESYGFNPDFLNECEAFTADDSHEHDDQIDALYYLVVEALVKHQTSILDYYLRNN